MNLSCPHCQTNLDLTGYQPGAMVTCSVCSKPFTIPQQSPNSPINTNPQPRQTASRGRTKTKSKNSGKTNPVPSALFTYAGWVHLAIAVLIMLDLLFNGLKICVELLGENNFITQATIPNIMVTSYLVGFIALSAGAILRILEK